MSSKVKSIAMGMVAGALVLVIYNKVPAVRRLLGGA